MPIFGCSFRIADSAAVAPASALVFNSTICPGSPIIRIRHVLSQLASNGLLSKSRCFTFTKSEGDRYGSSGFCSRVAQQHVTNAASSVEPRIAESNESGELAAPLRL